MLGQRQQRRRHRAGGVDDGLEVRVVEVEGVRGDAVDQRGAGHVDPLGAAQHAGLRGGLQQLHGGQRRIGGFVVRGADGAAQPVEEGAVRLVVHRVAPAARGVAGDELGQDLRDGRGVVVGGDLGVAGHEGLSLSGFRNCGAQDSSWMLRSRASLVQRAMSARMNWPNCSDVMGIGSIASTESLSRRSGGLEHGVERVVELLDDRRGHAGRAHHAVPLHARRSP